MKMVYLFRIYNVDPEKMAIVLTYNNVLLKVHKRSKNIKSPNSIKTRLNFIKSIA